MFERFTDRAKKVVALASQEAARLQREYVEPHDLLVGILKEGTGVGPTSLKNLSLDLTKVRAEISKLVPLGSTAVVLGKLPLTPASKKVFSDALSEGERLGAQYVGTEHILLALMKQSDGVHLKVIRRLGLDPSVVIEATELLISQTPPEESAAAFQPERPQCGSAAELRQIARIFKMLFTLVSTGMTVGAAMPYIVEAFSPSRDTFELARVRGHLDDHWMFSKAMAAVRKLAFFAPIIAAGEKSVSVNSAISLVGTLAERLSDATRPAQLIEPSELQKVIDFQVLAMLLSDTEPDRGFEGQACEIIAETSPSSNAKAFGLVSRRMKEGERLSAAMARVIAEPVGDFAQRLVPLLKAGEESDTTDILLTLYAGDLLTDLIHPVAAASDEDQS